MKYNSIMNLNPDFCAGCGACYNKCPANAIEMKMNQEGFYSPIVDNNNCLDCGLCSRVCPVMYPYKNNNVSPKAYAVKTLDEIRMKSTSAGVFAVLSNYFLEKGGYVCGAAYNDKFEVVHLLTNDKEKAERIRKSKYVQSNIQLCFRDIKKLLDEDKIVFFSGTPCQVAAIKNYINSFNKKYDNLFTMDIICHGVPSPGNWDEYLNENFNINEIKSIDFRHKGDHGFKKHYISFKFKDGSESVKKSSDNAFFRHFTRNLGLRKSCAHCEGAVFPRTGDFSAGDFWGAETVNPEWIDSDNGISVIMINNEKASAILNEISSQFTMMNSISPKEAMQKNRRNITRQMHINRENFFRSLKQNNDFVKAYKENINSKYDVALYGNTLGSNYGGILTYFALYQYIKNIGKKVVMIRPPKKNSVSESERFFSEYTTISKPRKIENFKHYNNLADTFVIGSDQVWNYKLFSGKKLSYYLDFVDDSKKKISYAASFGFDVPTVIEFKPEMYPNTVKNINKFDHISVREADGVDVCRNYYGSSATHVLDPVFLLEKEEYIAVAEKAERKPEGKFLTVYTLTPGEDYNKALKYTANKIGLQRINMGPGTKKKYLLKMKNFDEPYLENITPEEWLYNIANAEYVITDSYHCVCFSIIFKKNFVIVQKSWAISRIKSLLEKLNLTDRWFSSSDELKKNSEILFKDIDYDKVYEILEKEKDFSKKWFSDALNSPKKAIQHNIIYPSKIDYEPKQYFSKLQKSQTDYIYIALKYEDDSAYVSDINFPNVMNIGPKTKSNFSNKPFVCVCDPQNIISQKKRGPFPLICYQFDHIKISAFSCENKVSGRNATVSVEYADGIKKIYNCNLDAEGMYFFVYSKTKKKMIDVKFIGDDFQSLHYDDT